MGFFAYSLPIQSDFLRRLLNEMTKKNSCHFFVGNYVPLAAQKSKMATEQYSEILTFEIFETYCGVIFTRCFLI